MTKRLEVRGWIYRRSSKGDESNSAVFQFIVFSGKKKKALDGNGMFSIGLSLPDLKPQALIMLEKLLPKHFIPKQERESYQTYLAHKADIDQYLQYLEMTTRLPVIHRIKQNNIQYYQEKYGFDLFVETGTYLGDMVEAQKDHFKKLISIELSHTLFDQAVERFKKDTHIQILQGDSGKVLKEVIKYLQEPALFWLDGHYSSGITAKTDKNTPILEELKTIFNSPYHHGILIDDARLFTGKEDYPSIDELCLLVKEYAPERKVEVADDIIRIFK